MHFSIQSNHLHLIAEAQGRRALALGLQGLSVRLGRAVNRALARRGRLFADRYHARALKTPRAAVVLPETWLLRHGVHLRGRFDIDDEPASQ